MKLFAIIAFMAIIMFGITACDDGSSTEPPYIEHGIWYIGFYPGLNESSSSQQFNDAYLEIYDEYFKNIDDSNTVIYNGITYEVIDWQWINPNEPEYIWDAFWDDYWTEYEYHGIGSCYISNYIVIPSKGGNGTLYALNVIITNNSLGYYYWSSKAILRAVESRSTSLLKTSGKLNLFYGKDLIQKGVNHRIMNGAKETVLKK
jgi:hypothetical protein